MVIMFLLFIIQISVSIGALAVTHDQQADLMKAGWKTMDLETKEKIQSKKDCCGFQNKTLPANDTLGHPDCRLVSSEI